MINVVLPSSDPDAIAYAQSQLDTVYHIYFVYGSVKNVQSSETIFFTRLSAQVYVQMSDFMELSHLLPKIISEYYVSKGSSEKL